MTLADARAIRPDLVIYEADFEADARLLDRLAAWCDRFTPVVVVDEPDGLFLDIGGSAHLFGGEAALLETVKKGLSTHGCRARCAIAPTIGAAWAATRFNTSDIIEDDALAKTLMLLPVAALRLAPEAMALLNRLGLKTIGQIADAPRRCFSARAGQQAMLRLDQAMGRTREVLRPRRPIPRVFTLKRLIEPLTSLDAVLIAIEAACGDLSFILENRGLGARLLRLSLFGVDGKARVFLLGLTRPERDPKIMLRLFKERLHVEAEKLNAEFGIEIVRLDVMDIAPTHFHMTDLMLAAERDLEAEARLTDALSARFGRSRITPVAPRNTHTPELAGGARAGTGRQSLLPADGVMRRPLTLFAVAQPIDAISSVPDGAPVSFRWRRVLREITRAEGPERIDAAFLPGENARGRDYYRIEDATGRRYWVYREGFYDEVENPRWFLHGLFP